MRYTGKRGDFWSKVDVSAGLEGCWPWMGAMMRHRDERGYLKRKGKSIYAHRMAYMLACGDIPDGMHVCHHCDNTICCNPRHLFVGTQRENIADRDRKGRCRARGPAGERNGRAKLTVEMVLEIRRQAPGCSQRALANKFGVSQAAVRLIVIRKNWAHLPETA